MGSGASTQVERSLPLQEKTEALSKAVNELIALTWDRVHIRLHDGDVGGGSKKDCAVNFKIVSGSEHPIDHELLDESNSPTRWKSRLVKSAANPIWHENATLLFLRSPEASYVSSNDAPVHKLEVVFVADRAGIVGDLVDAVAGESLSVLFQETIQLPSPSANWVLHEISSEDGTKVRFDLRVELQEKPVCTAAEINAFTDRMTVTKIEELSGGDCAVMRHIKKEGNQKALLWIPGRNDSFKNPIFGEVLLNSGYDVYVLDPRRCGACRKYFPNTIEPDLVHSTNDMYLYGEEVDLALKVIEAAGYAQPPVGYAHSTGSLILAAFLMRNGDDRFSSFVLNAPFFDWGHVGGDLNEFVLERGIANLSSMGLVEGTGHLASSGGGSLIDMSTWHHKSLAAHQFDPDTQPLYKVEVTNEWVAAVTQAQGDLRERLQKGFLTLKPMCVLASAHDDILAKSEMAKLTAGVSPQRTLVELQWASHDVVASSTKEKSDEAISYVLAFLVSND
eukprot:CAMPEP_0171700204 /NCGR_PEP_ID=MMETSP0991-20121206/10404_1 /TAXON_ID=483369 /ORGANISM="non described non described, Strain CCMP2098" /LENGTH=504 /DNA_ID=CAMNT_0012289397 /DNA_START=73 /DNA_END=1588 /DNA_ORIENTATION=+